MRKLAACAVLLLLAAAARAQVATQVAEAHGEIAGDWKALSPNGLFYARAETGAISLTTPGGYNPPRRIPLRSTPGLPGFQFSPPPLHWDESSDAIWLTFLDDGPVRVSLDGTIATIVPPDPGAWPLDALLYIDGRGLAVATYSTRWAADRRGPPTLAVIDLARSRVLGSVRLDGEFPGDGVTGRIREGEYGPQGIAARSLPDGSVRVVALFQSPEVEYWLMAWDSQGPVRMIRTPYGSSVSQFAISPDGTRILVAMARGPNDGCPVDVFCKPVPVTDATLALYDFDSGKLQWERVERDIIWLRPGPPMFTPDGRFAVATMPMFYDPKPRRPARGLHAGRLGIISLRDGRLIEEFETRSHNVTMQWRDESDLLLVHAFDTTHWFRMDWAEAARIEAVLQRLALEQPPPQRRRRARQPTVTPKPNDRATVPEPEKSALSPN